MGHNIAETHEEYIMVFGGLESLPPIIGTGLKAVDTAVRQAQNHLAKARELSQDNVRACRHYMDAASECIHGLEDGYEELLANAQICLDWPENITLVRGQIETYLEVHQLRRRLMAASKGLKPIKDELERNANKFWQWPWSKPNKQAAVKEFTERLKELTDYLAKLENQDLRHRPTGTGVAVRPLEDIFKQLGKIKDSLNAQGSVSSQDIPEEMKTHLKELVQKARIDHSKAGLEPITGNINTTIEELRLAFAA
jgi:hypothetical protein